jgi:hypothetical protein
MKKKEERRRPLSLFFPKREREFYAGKNVHALSLFLIKNLFVEVSSAMLGKRERKNETCSLSLSLRARVCVCVFVCLNALVVSLSRSNSDEKNYL